MTFSLRLRNRFDFVENLKRDGFDFRKTNRGYAVIETPRSIRGGSSPLPLMLKDVELRLIDDRAEVNLRFSKTYLAGSAVVAFFVLTFCGQTFLGFLAIFSWMKVILPVCALTPFVLAAATRFRIKRVFLSAVR